jgi:hypothetical protein
LEKYEPIKREKKFRENAGESEKRVTAFQAAFSNHPIEN